MIIFPALTLVYRRYVFGVTHVPRLEDWPVMPVDRIGFMLQVCYFGIMQIAHSTDCPVMPLMCVDVIGIVFLFITLKLVKFAFVI